MIFIQLTDTERLTIAPLQEADHLFIMELLNTEGWIKFIGDRNVHSPEDALAYIHKVNANNAIRYWTVKTKHNNIPIGIVTLIQRDYLHQPDIGFAFLPAAAGKGYALEASAALMEKLLADNNITSVHAVILPANKPSVSLVTKLGLRFEKSMQVDDNEIFIYTYKKDAG